MTLILGNPTVGIPLNKLKNGFLLLAFFLYARHSHLPFSAKEYHGANVGVTNTKMKIQRNDGIRKDSRSSFVRKAK